MSMDQNDIVQRDERTVAVENAGYKVAYTFVIFALLADICYRSAFRHEGAWDLFAIIMVTGFMSVWYQVRHKGHTSFRRFLLGAKEARYIRIFGMIFAAIVAAVAVMLSRMK